MKETRLRQMVGDDRTYNLLIETYKRFLKENRKKEFYYFRGLLLACIEAQDDVLVDGQIRWRTPKDLFAEFHNQEKIDYLIELAMKTDKNSKSWFDRTLQYSITRTL